MAVPDYTGLFRFVYDWQTFIAGMGAIYGGWLAYRAGIGKLPPRARPPEIKSRRWRDRMPT